MADRHGHFVLPKPGARLGAVAAKDDGSARRAAVQPSCGLTRIIINRFIGDVSPPLAPGRCHPEITIGDTSDTPPPDRKVLPTLL